MALCPILFLIELMTSSYKARQTWAWPKSRTGDDPWKRSSLARDKFELSLVRLRFDSVPVLGVFGRCLTPNGASCQFVFGPELWPAHNHAATASEYGLCHCLSLRLCLVSDACVNLFSSTCPSVHPQFVLWLYLRGESSLPLSAQSFCRCCFWPLSAAPC